VTNLTDRLRTFWGTKRIELVRFAKFCVVGVIGAVVDFGLLNLGIQAFGLQKWLANTFSFFAAVLSNFTWNRFWTYPETRHDPILPQLGRFVLVNIGGYAINQAIFLSLDRFVFPAEWGALGYNIAKVVATGVVLFWNYGVNRIWTYGRVK
jgi:putative flippase GtrA